MKLLFLFVFALTFFSCANITTPSGGPKDLAPPELVSSKPNNKEINYKGQTIELVFDEYVKLNNPKEEIIISPSPGREIEFKVKGTKVTITPESKWKDTTTYSILFRDGIQDITENNSPINLKIAFSTGPHIDSLSLAGTITDLLSGEATEKITVAIYSQDTFNIFNHSPNYFTKTNKKGAFQIENIKDGNYKIYAFEDKNKNLKVESRTERFGFISKSLPLHNAIDTLALSLVMLDSRKLKFSSIRSAGTITRVRFNKYITEFKLESEKELISSFGDNQTELNIWSPANLSDSLKAKLSVKDSLEYNIDSTFYIKSTGKTFKESFKWSLGENRVDSETGNFFTTLEFNKPLININFDSIYIEIDTVNRINFTKKDFVIDEAHKLIDVRKEIDKKLFKTETPPRLKLKAGNAFVYSIDNDTSKKLSDEIIIYWPESTGILHIQTDTKEKFFIIQLLNAKGKIAFSVFNQSKYTFKNLNPEEYQIRIVIDKNQNKKWDPGNFEKKIEPEKVIFYKTSTGKTKFPIRANWELGPLIIKF